MARLIVAALLLLAPSLAWADPFSLIATAIVNGAGLTGLGALAVYAGAGLLRTASAKKKARKARAAQIAAYNASLQERTAQLASTETAERYVYGAPAPIAGNIVANFVSGPKDEFRHLVIYLASHECATCDAIYADGVNIGALDGNGWVTSGEFYENGAEVQADPVFFAGASVTLPHTPIPGSLQAYVSRGGEDTVAVSYSVAGTVVTIDAPYDGADQKVVQYRYQTFNPRLRVSMHLSPGGVDTADAGLMAAVPGQWTAAHKASNTTYAVVTMDLRMARFQGGPPVFTFRLRGKPVYDPRTALVAYSANPALCTLDYLRSRHGGAVALSQFDASWIAAANACDTAAYTPAPNTGNTADLFRCDAVFTLDQGREAIIANFEASFSGEISESAGMWRMRAGVWTPPVITLGDADIFGLVEQAQAAFPLESRFNGARGQYLDAAGLGVTQDAVPYANAAFLAADGNEPRIDDVPMGFISSEQRAQHAMRVRVERSRGGQILKVPASPKAWALQPGDRVTLSYSPYQITSRTYRITNWSTSLAGGAALEMERDEPSIWDLADATTAYTQPSSDLPSPFAVPLVEPLNADSGDAYLRRMQDGTIVAGVRLTWPAASDVFVAQGGRVEFQTRSVLDASAAWQAHAPEEGDASFTTLYGLQDGLHYLIRARFVNQRRIPGAWTTIAHQVIGKTAPPPAPAFVSLTQTTVFAQEVDVLDLAGYRLRAIAGSVAATASDFARGSSMHDGFVTDFPWTIQQTLYGVQTVMVVAEDTSGNQSTPAYAVLDFGQPDSGSIGQAYSQGAAGWLGDKLRCAVDAGALKADADPVSDLFAIAEMFGEPDLFVGLWLDMVYTAEPFTPIFGGGTLVLDLDAVGDNVQVEFRKLASGVDDLFASLDLFAADDLLGLPTEWAPWPGALRVRRHEVIQLRVSIAGGGLRGQINSMELRLALQRGTQDFSPRAFGSGGLRLAPADGQPARVWAEIRTVGILPKVDGSGAVSGRWFDLDERLGPLVELVNVSGVAVTGTATATVGGLIDEDL
jgi:hypothetical protein